MMIDFIIRILEKIIAALHFLSGRSGIIEKLFSFFGGERDFYGTNVYGVLVFLAIAFLSGLLLFFAFAAVKRRNVNINYKEKSN